MIVDLHEWEISLVTPPKLCYLVTEDLRAGHFLSSVHAQHRFVFPSLHSVSNLHQHELLLTCSPACSLIAARHGRHGGGRLFMVQLQETRHARVRLSAGCSCRCPAEDQLPWMTTGRAGALVHTSTWLPLPNKLLVGSWAGVVGHHMLMLARSRG
ncbi:hypothetical protein SETIT_9G146400v2 [Setaria italica]|uniref:Uncharacterized protein n=1 Tax=Setaria italica TaxID=4555 RepID=A0A368SGR8_SETIT|nr:hypothetical protein SETIT_9G146400v2 [Setaria italica]